MAERVVIEGKSLEELEREITCGICQEHYTEPKILPCHHYYCKQCVLRLALRMATGQPFSCPECRSEATLPEGGVDELKTAFYINRLKTTVSTMKTTHGKEEAPTRSCQKHEEPLIIYCFDCDSLICQHCTVIDHHGHNMEFCKVTAPTTKKKLQEKLESLKDKKRSLKQASLGIQAARQQIKANGDDVATSIQKSFKQLREILDKREQELLQEAAGTIRRKMNKLSEQEEKLSIANAEVQSVVDYTEQCVSHCTDNEVMSMHTEIRRLIEQKIEEHSKSGRSLEPMEKADIGVEVSCAEALQQLCQTQANIIQLHVDPAKCTVTMEDDSNHKVNKITNAILVIKISNNTRRHHEVSCSLRSLYNNVTTKCKVAATGAGQYSIEYTPTVRGRHELTVSVDGQQVAGSPFPVFVSIHPIQLGKPVKVWRDLPCPRGITVTSGREILVSTSDGKIFRFDKDGHRTTLVQQKKVEHLMKIEVDDKNIYCIDGDSNKILKCSHNGSNIQVVRIKNVSEGLCGLAVLGEEAIVTEDDNRGTVMVYDKELKYVRRIEHQHVGTIMALSADHHGNLYCTDCSSDMIHVFSNDGVFLHSFGCDEEGKKKVKTPYGLCVSGHYVYVCNYGSDCISVFTTDGLHVTSFGQYGNNKGDFNCPHSVCVDKDGYVYVTDSYNYRVQCF